MKSILCYGDSNTWGYNPDSGKSKLCRFGRQERWTGKLQQMLGRGYYVIEAGLNGRTTAFDDPTSPSRNGAKHIFSYIQSNEPLDLIILMLGTNDTKPVFNKPVIEIANGLTLLLKNARNPYNYDTKTIPKILIVAPIHVGEDAAIKSDGMFDPQSIVRSKGLAAAYKKIADIYQCHFFDAATVAAASPADQIHLDRAGHNALAGALYHKVLEIL